MTDDLSIPAALTPEEWTKVRRSPPGLVWFSADDATMNRHKMAARCLYNFPYGFTHEDVELLRLAALTEDRAADWCPDGYVRGILDEITYRDRRKVAACYRALADRIASLLPPTP